MGFVQRRLLRIVLRVVARPRLTLGIAGALLAASVCIAWTHLTLSTDQDKLFSRNVPFFREWLEFNERFPENQALYVLVRAKDAAHPPEVTRWTELADRITERLRAMPDAVEAADSHVPVEQLAKNGQGLLLDPPADLPQDFKDTLRLVPLARLWGEAQGLTGLLGRTPVDRFLVGFQIGPPDAEQAGLARLVADGWAKAMQRPGQPIQLGDQVPDLNLLGASDPSKLGYYYEPDADDPKHEQHHLLVRVYDKERAGGLSSSAESVEQIKAAARDVAKSFPEFTVGITGQPAIDADEMRITDRDSDKAETIAMIAVFIGLVVMLRSIWLALAAEICLAVGIGWTFGWATLAVGELNLLSIVFIIALIGIGMDYLVQILMRYRLEARRYVRPRAVWTRVFRYVSPPIFTACFGAAGAFFVSVFTEFRGAADLGIIASGGLILCLLSGYTVLPALLVLFPPKLAPFAPGARYKPQPRMRSIARRLVLPAIWMSLLALGIPFALRAQFDSNLLDLQPPGLESVRLVRKLQTWSAVVMSKDLDLVRGARSAVENAPTVADTDSVLNGYDNLGWLRKHQAEVPRVQWAEPAAVRAGDLPRIAAEARALAKYFSAFAVAPAPPVGSAPRAVAIQSRPTESRATVRGADPTTAAAPPVGSAPRAVAIQSRPTESRATVRGADPTTAASLVGSALADAVAIQSRPAESGGTVRGADPTTAASLVGSALADAVAIQSRPTESRGTVRGADPTTAAAPPVGSAPRAVAIQSRPTESGGTVRGADPTTARSVVGSALADAARETGATASAKADPTKAVPGVVALDARAAEPDEMVRGADPTGNTEARGPDDAAEMREAAAALNHFADLLTNAATTPEMAAQRLSAWQVEFIAEMRNIVGQLAPPDFDVSTLPPELRSHYLSKDGYYALYINPKLDLWNRANLRQFVHEVEARIATAPGHLSATGVAVDVYHTTRAVQKSFYQATFYALGLIFLLVLLDLRNLTQTLLAISVLAVGLPMLVALMGLIGYSWNFANFFGLPILIGAGHEYGVFMMHRYKETLQDPRRVWRRWDVSDRALLLCAFVTCSSFGFFWAMSQHIGLKSLGFVMALGSACIYLATIMVLRPLLKLRLDLTQRRKERRERMGGFAVMRGKPEDDGGAEEEGV